MSDANTFISKSAIKRLIADITHIEKNSLADHGIYYKHDDEDILKGFALIVGPKDTVYFGGYYFFEFNFPGDYPVRPPVLKYCTNDGQTRFHPNLYKSGKCCLSILNTWKGEQWTGCQTITSILLVLVSILNNKPLLNEPGICESHKDFKPYNNIIRYKNFEISILKMLDSESNYLPTEKRELFYPFMKEHWDRNKEELLAILEKYKNKKMKIVQTSLYGMKIRLDYPILYKHFISFIKLK